MARFGSKSSLRDLADDLNSGSSSLADLLARSDAPPSAPGDRPRRAAAPRRVCDRCLEARNEDQFPARGERPDRPSWLDGVAVCIPCLKEARDVEAVRRTLYGDPGAWAGRRIAEEGRRIAPWGPGVLCPHCGRPMPQTSAYTWACRGGWTTALLCEAVPFRHVHSICRSCAYEELYVPTYDLAESAAKGAA